MEKTFSVLGKATEEKMNLFFTDSTRLTNKKCPTNYDEHEMTSFFAHGGDAFA